MQLVCLRPSINTLISIILAGFLTIILIAQVAEGVPFQQFYYRDTEIDLRGYINGQAWFSKKIKNHTVEGDGNHSNNSALTPLGEQSQQSEKPDQNQSEQHDQPSDEQTDQAPDGQSVPPPYDKPKEPMEEQMDNFPEGDQGDDFSGDSGELPADSIDTNIPPKPDSYRWPYECPKGPPEPKYMSETCSYVNGSQCNLCAGGTVLLCCSNIKPGQEVMNGSGTNHIFQNTTAKRVYIRLMLTTIEEGAFRGSENVETLHIIGSDFGHMKRMDRIFEGLHKLRALHLDNNGITTWDTTDTDVTNSDKSLQMLPSLEVLSLKGNLFESLESNFFEWLQGSSLRYLNLEGCNKIVNIDPGILLPVSNSLWILELAYTNLNEDNLTNILSSNLTQLKALGLKSLGLQHVPRTALEMVNSSLEVLSLQGNPLTCISDSEKCDQPPPPPEMQNKGMQQDIFPYMPKLRELSLANCDIDVFPENTFHNLENLRTLFIHRNDHSQFQPGIFQNLKKLKYLNMREIASEGDLQIDFSGLNELEILDASYTRLSILEHVFCNLPNLKELLLRDSGITYYEPTVSKCFTNLKVLDLSGSEVLCNCFHKIFKESLNLSKLAMSDCFHGDIELKPNVGLLRNLTLLKDLSLEKNEFQCVEKLEFIQDLHNLETLNLNNNKLVSWDEYTFPKNEKLKNLFIASNEIASISKSMMTTFLGLNAVDASDNPYLCYCSLTHFNEFVQKLRERRGSCTDLCRLTDGWKHQENSPCLEKCRRESEYNKDLQQIIDYVNNSYKAEDVNLNILGWSEGNYQCLDSSGRKNIRNFQFEDWQCFANEKLGSTKPEEQINTTWKIVVIVVSCVIVLMLGICFWKWRFIYQFGRAVRSVTLLRLLDDEKDNPNSGQDNAGSAFSYDVFISYSDPNRHWVLEELVPNFEMDSDLKVCLHERDFQVGLSILENIISCMDQSRSILLVISQAFLRSQWCQFELHMAQHRLLETRREDLILVLLEEIPTSRRPKMLRYLMLTKTYIQWPGYDAGAEELKLFWKRLRRAVLLPRVIQNQETSA